ncbi:MAG: hypothetical protein Q7S89_01635 [bacterium]|nr:hypothetical protein [bacterium]
MGESLGVAAVRGETEKGRAVGRWLFSDALGDSLGEPRSLPIQRFVISGGRCVFFAGMKGTVVQANRETRIIRPEQFDTSNILARLRGCFPPDTVFETPADFKRRVALLTERIVADSNLRSLLTRGCLPICLPQFAVDDYGAALEGTFLPSVKRAYERQFRGRTFDSSEQPLVGRVGVVPESRHQKLLNQMATKPVVGLYFPTPLQGFSFEAAREVIAAAPEGFVLSGAIDIATAMVAFPNVLARDLYTLSLDCAANTWGSSQYSLRFECDDRSLSLCRWNAPSTDSSGGLLFIG